MNIFDLTDKEKVELREWLGEEEYKEYEERRIRINKLQGYDSTSNQDGQQYSK